MSKQEKLLKRLQSLPTDFTYQELEALLHHYGFEPFNKGKTSGSRMVFINSDNRKIDIHKPHPKAILKRYQLKIIIEALKEANII